MRAHCVWLTYSSAFNCVYNINELTAPTFFSFDLHFTTLVLTVPRCNSTVMVPLDTVVFFVLMRSFPAMWLICLIKVWHCRVICHASHASFHTTPSWCINSHTESPYCHAAWLSGKLKRVENRQTLNAGTRKILRVKKCLRYSECSNHMWVRVSSHIFGFSKKKKKRRNYHEIHFCFFVLDYF